MIFSVMFAMFKFCAMGVDIGLVPCHGSMGRAQRRSGWSVESVGQADRAGGRIGSIAAGPTSSSSHAPSNQLGDRVKSPLV